MAQDNKTPLFGWRAREQLLARRIVVLDGPLDDDNGTLLMTQILTLAAENPLAGISLWIHSPGGSVPAMLAIRDTMRLVPCEVSTLALGIAYSAGQFLLSSGTRGHRFALPHARVLMHQGSAGIGGSAGEVEIQADDLRHTIKTVLTCISEDTGQPYERVYEDSLHDRYYTAQQALEYGFIDRIVESFDQVIPQKQKVGIS
ncbi:ATP-dependent Clp protease proteolytic subunit [Nocardia sp. CDC159]|uniref:ATP-dependent Clp protease proteolytic subunit n=1 Tax=Nocardia pulmonis TaxID=2951408 RepID=A0A9X2J132_9NOCA|nr:MULTISPECIES: ATP-dependent Clp protease proteolytic subunit [Nocardia]MCM6777670.1 ATP-dependent Clp protease proteolytic subunit [Nocardia pulmonis]MCM6790526.1 ATP-dependent Clp protease proteolytic subunit [Nocardia sp. CDC159]